MLALSVPFKFYSHAKESHHHCYWEIRSYWSWPRQCYRTSAFVHPSEAYVILEWFRVRMSIAISYSGGSSEVLNIMPVIRKIEILWLHHGEDGFSSRQGLRCDYPVQSKKRRKPRSNIEYNCDSCGWRCSCGMFVKLKNFSARDFAFPILPGKIFPDDWRN